MDKLLENLINECIRISPGNYSEEVIPDPIRTRKSSFSAPMVLCLKTWKSRTLPG